MKRFAPQLTKSCSRRSSRRCDRRFSIGVLRTISAPPPPQSHSKPSNTSTSHGRKLIKIGKDKNGIESRDVLTKKWTDRIDYWAVDFDYESRREIIKVPKNFGATGELPGVVTSDGEFVDFEERWTGGYIFENEWQSFRTRHNCDLELRSATRIYAKPGRYTVAVKVIDIFGNDTMTLVPVTVG